MSVLLVFLFLGVATVAGFGIARVFSSELRFSEKIAWGFAVGLLLQAGIEVGLLAARLNPGPKKIVVTEAAIALAAFSIPRHWIPTASAVSEDSPGSYWFFWLIAAAVVLLFGVVALSSPMWTTDFLAIWGLKGKTIFATSSIPKRLFHDPSLVWSHPEYPMLLPLTFASLAAELRAWDDYAMAILYPIVQAVTALAVGGFLSRRVSRMAGGIGACLTAICFPLYSAGNIGLAEIPLALGLVLLSSAAIDAVEVASGASRARLLVASFLCATIKQEGTLFALLVAGALVVVGRRRGLGASRYTWIWAAAPVLVHGLLWRLLRGPVQRPYIDFSLLEPRRWGELVTREFQVVKHLLTVEIPGAAITIGAIALFFILTRSSFADWLFVPLGAQAVAYAAFCAISAFGAVWWLEASYSRIIVTLLPPLTLVLGARLPVRNRRAAEPIPR